MKKIELINYEEPKTLSEVPEATCSKAGVLVTKNAGWRNVRPVINENKCKGCGQCYLYCPDGVISLKDGKPVIDYDFCKGCGICENICNLNAITMETEEKYE